jgi:tyrosyl-tRNA synthetase
VAVILPLLEGTDGVQKMSKSLGNYVGVAEPPGEIFGKVMSIDDVLMLRWFELLTEVDVEALRRGLANDSEHPMELKKRLAEMLTARFHGAAAATTARRAFEERFQARHLDAAALAEIAVAARDGALWLPGALSQAGLVKSNSEARRLIKQGAVRIDGRPVDGEVYPCAAAAELVLEVGKRRAVRIRVS